ncbi:nitric-oxide reductase large subunit [Paenibacillus sanfengchensis]|uniref:nitric-oxide reductase large subunit n=1 Tax=Paenibacillus sanfengchensis TaxID=3119819 RepID=UPI002FE18A7C
MKVPGNKAQNGFLKGILIATLIISFTILITGGYWIFKTQAPTPLKMVDSQGQTLTTQDQIAGGQAVFQKYGLMDYATVLGHGSYLGPDYTAEALKIVTDAMHNHYAQTEYGQSYDELSKDRQTVIFEKVKEEVKQNRYEKGTEVLTLTDGQVEGLKQVRAHYEKVFTEGDGLGIAPNLIQDSSMPAEDRAYIGSGNMRQQIADFFFWTAWLSAAQRPGDTITYTNNWPYFEDAGNTMSYSAVLWSGVSVTLLILAIGFILFIYNRYKLHMHEAYTPDKFPTFNLYNMPVTSSQVKTGKFFLIVTLLFLIQSGFGGLLAHYYSEPNQFYGMDWIASLFPFNIAKSYHLQLVILWVATAWLGMGIYVAPLVGGKEPKRQGLLVDILFWALVVLTAGSTIGEWLGVKGHLGNLWFWLGHQGWEYLELGRFWQILLVIGMTIWLYIVFRAIRSALRKETDKGGLTHLLFYSAIAVPFFYIFAFFFNPTTSFTYADFWRWWIIHLWVEGIFEVFAVVVIGFLMVRMNLVTKQSTIRSLLFQFILLMGGGVLGIGHHYYYNGSSEIWIALGAVFSALEVIPLTLLILEAYDQYKVMKDGGTAFPYTSSFRFLVSTAVWNLIGAGVLGFLINLPAVSYFEHGSTLTTAHAHGSMMGVYGMFAIAVLLYTLRNIVEPDKWNDKLLRLSCWGLNIGLTGMIVITLLPIGFMQLKHAFDFGFWSARHFSFYQQGDVNLLLWLRMIPDTVFIVLGILPLLYAVIRSMFHLRKPNVAEEQIFD